LHFLEFYFITFVKPIVNITYSYEKNLQPTRIDDSYRRYYVGSGKNRL